MIESIQFSPSNIANSLFCHSNIISSRLKSKYNWLFSQKNQNVSPNFPGRVFLSIYMRIQYSRSFYRNNEVHLHKNPYIRVSKRCCFHFGLGSISPTFHKMVCISRFDILFWQTAFMSQINKSKFSARPTS